MAKSAASKNSPAQAAPDPNTSLARSLAALYERKNDAGFQVLSAVSGVPQGRLSELRDGGEPTLMEKVTLESLAQFTA